MLNQYQTFPRLENLERKEIWILVYLAKCVSPYHSCTHIGRSKKSSEKPKKKNMEGVNWRVHRDWREHYIKEK